jgi:hypothetical protein
MIITNRFNLPQPFVDAVSVDEYERGSADYTATELVRPVRILSYTRTHWDEIEEDASDRLWAMQGQSKHIVLQNIARKNPDRYLVEERFETELPKSGRKVSGKIDLFDKIDRILYDWKESSVFKFILGDTKEWEQQANVCLYLMRMNDVDVRDLVNIALLKDWKIRKARTTKRDDYPKCAVNVLPLPMWTVGQAQDYILKRIKTYEDNRENPPVCTKAERWQRDHTYAVMKRKGSGKPRAVPGGLRDERDQAEAILRSRIKSANPGEKFFIEERPTEPVRCLDFCSVWKWCDFGRQAKKDWAEQQAVAPMEGIPEGVGDPYPPQIPNDTTPELL